MKTNDNNLVLIQKALSTLYPKCFNRNTKEDMPFFTKKKEGLISYYTIDDYEALYKISDVRHGRSRRWIKRRKKRSLQELQSLQKKSIFYTSSSVILNKKTTLLNAKAQQAIQLKTFLPFVKLNSQYSYLLSVKKVLRQIKAKQKNFYVLKPRRGGYHVYFSGALGFFRKRQGRTLFRVRTQKRYKLFREITASKNCLPKPIYCQGFKHFRGHHKFRGFHKKRKLVKTKIKRGRRRLRVKLTFTFRLFKRQRFKWWLHKKKQQNQKNKNKTQSKKKNKNKSKKPKITTV